MTEFLYKEETYNIIGACFKVYNEMGHGFLEAVYQECLELEFSKEKIPYNAQHILTLNYSGTELKQHYIPDFICYDHIIIELKAAKKLEAKHEAQLFNYLKATKLKIGILVNFGTFPKLEYKRIIAT